MQVYTAILISTIVDLKNHANRKGCLYGHFNFYYCRCSNWLDVMPSLYGHFNFYYCRSISTYRNESVVYTAILISTIVDWFGTPCSTCCLYGHFNFYYCRSQRKKPLSRSVYTAILISTIVDTLSTLQRGCSLYGHFNFYYCR